MKTINSIRINYQIDIKNYQIDIKTKENSQESKRTK